MVYQTARQGTFTYTLPGLTAGNSYTLRLHFAELSATAAGQRKFNVSVNGAAVLTNFDIFATAGGEEQGGGPDLYATADANGQITVSFTSVTEMRQPQWLGAPLGHDARVGDQRRISWPAARSRSIPPPSPTKVPVQAIAWRDALDQWVRGRMQPTITANAATLSLGDQSSSSTNTWTNTGTITATLSTVNLGGIFTKAQLGTFTRTGGTVNLVGTLDNTGTTLALSTTTGSWNLLGGILKNGTLTEAGGAALVFTASGGTLDGVTANGDLDLTQNNGAFAFVQNGLVLNGTARVGSAVGATAAQLYFNGTQTLSGTGTVLFGKSGNNSLNARLTGAVLTLAPTITVRGSSGTLGATSGTDTIINQGTISADDSGGASAFAYDTDVSGGGTTGTPVAIDTSGVTNTGAAVGLPNGAARDLHLHTPGAHGRE